MNPEASAPVDTWRVVSLSPLPGWALVALALAIVAGIAFASWGVRKESDPRKRAALWSLRALAGVCALFFLLEPALQNLQVARVKSRVAVVVDRSASMGFPVEPKGVTRSQAVAQALEAAQPELESLKDRYTFEYLGFDGDLSPISPETLRKEPPRGGRTDLLETLKAVKATDVAKGTRKLAGVVLISDGADNTDLSQGFTPRAKRAVTDLGVPLTTVSVGEDALKDLAIDSIKVDDFAFVRSSITVEATVHARGFKGEVTHAVLRREGRVVASREVRFDNNDETKTVSFQFTPDQTGRFVYTVTMPVYPDEAVTENNSRSFALKVIRDRVRVLLVSGRPSWDERFLRGLLRQDPNVELISFYILRSQSDATQSSDDEKDLSLIPFPTDEIFREKVDTFDVIIFLNFGYTEPGLSITAYEPYLKRYVQNGGALAVVGGDRSFGAAHYSFTELADALPLEGLGTVDPAPFKARLTNEGSRHPVTALGGAASSNFDAWAALPAIPGINLTRAKPGATVLLEHPFATAEGKNAPLLALWEYGRGRSMALATDAAWYWAFPSHSGGAPTRHYEHFWTNALRWLVRDPDLTTLQITADPASVEPGRPVGAAIVARKSDYEPNADAELDVELIGADDHRTVGTQTVRANADGSARVEFPPPPAGAYRLVVKSRAPAEGSAPQQAEDAVAVRAVGPELADARVGRELLGEIAAKGGGKALALKDGLPLASLPYADPPLVEVGRSKDQPLWDRWYWLLALVMVLGAEWGLRRRFGYV